MAAEASDEVGLVPSVSLRRAILKRLRYRYVLCNDNEKDRPHLKATAP
jgi:hypothetical protein